MRVCFALSWYARVESACYIWSPSRLSISRRRVPGPRTASASAAVSTHSRGLPYPRAARTLLLTHLLACHVSVRAPFSLQTPFERSERVAWCWAVRARAHPLCPGVWHFTLRFVLPGSWVGYPKLVHSGRKARLGNAVALWTQSLPKWQKFCSAFSAWGARPGDKTHAGKVVGLNGTRVRQFALRYVAWRGAVREGSARSSRYAQHFQQA